MDQKPIYNPKPILQNLLKLQALEFDGSWNDEVEKQIAKYRAQIPPQILGHYQRMSERGKKGVAAVRNQVCAGCHVRVPRATVVYLMQAEDIQVCENCGAYLYLPEPAEGGVPVEAKAAVQPGVNKPAPKTRKRRVPAHAA